MRNEDRVDALLDQALEMTFPASDPFSIYSPPVDPDEALAERDADGELRGPYVGA